MGGKVGFWGVWLFLGPLARGAPSEPDLAIGLTDATTAVVRIHNTSATNAYTLWRAATLPFADPVAVDVMLGSTGEVASLASVAGLPHAFFRLRESSAEDPDGDGLCNLVELQQYGTSPLRADTDADTMPDNWEIENHLDPLADDGQADSDGDSVLNKNEYPNASDPNAVDTDDDLVPDALDPHPALNSDSDGDSLPDDWEQFWFKSLERTGGGDFDMDGVSDRDEFVLGTDPTKANQADTCNLCKLELCSRPAP
jgi:hypothetical protein